jgi:hypothetical protein
MTRTTLLTPEKIQVTMSGQNGMLCAVSKKKEGKIKKS